MYMNSLDGTVEWLAKNAQPSGKALPILDPVKIYNLSASAASALFTALAGSSYFPDAKAKLSLPHIEMNPVNKGLDKVLEQTAA